MIKFNGKVLIMASLLAFGACKKDKEEEAATESAKAATEETAVADTETTETAPVKPAATTDDTAPGDMTREQMAEKAMALFTKMSTVVKEAGEDCDKMGEELAKVVEEAKPVMEAGKKFDENPDDKKWFDETYGKQIEQVMGEMMTGLMQCKDNEKVQAAMEGMEG